MIQRRSGPGAAQIILYMLISLYMISGGILPDLLFPKDGRVTTLSELVNAGALDRLTTIQYNLPALGQIAIFLLWAVVGAVIYAGLWGVLNFSEELGHDIELGTDNYIHPKTWTVRSYWLEIFKQAAVQAGFVVVLASLLAVTIFITYPLAVDLTRPILLKQSVVNVLWTCFGVLILTSTLILFSVLARRIFKRAD